MDILFQFLLATLAIATSFLGAWIVSSIVAYLHGPNWLIILSAIALLPILPIWRELRSVLKWKRSFWSQHVPFWLARVSLRTLALNLMFIVLLLGLYPQLTFNALEKQGDWILGDRQGKIAQTLRATLRQAEQGLEALYTRASESLGQTPQIGQRERPTSPQTKPSPKAPSDTIAAVVAKTNQFRRQNGLSDLTLNDQLTEAAQQQSVNMARQDFFDHTDKAGKKVSDRVTATGYNWVLVAENIAAGQRTAEEVVQAWIKSPGHRANMLKPDLQDIGVGYVYLGNDTGEVNFHSYWTQVFGTPCPPLAICGPK